MANIYELTSDFQKIYMMLEEGTVEEAVLSELLSDTSEALAEKLEGYCKFIKNCEADAEGLKAEEKRLSDKRKAIEGTIANCKSAMKAAIEAANSAKIAAGEDPDNKIKAGTFTVGIQNNPPKLILDSGFLDEIPEAYLIKPEPEINKKAMIEALKDKEKAKELEGIAHLEQGTSIRIK